MMLWNWRFAFLALCLIAACPAAAINVVAVGSVGAMTSPSITSVRGNNWNSGNTGATINVSCYYGTTTSAPTSPACSGGGIFDSPAVAPPCGTADNGATVLQDSVGHCFYRRNFSANGTVDARECGVVGDGAPAGGVLPGGETHPDDGRLLNDCLGYAQGAGVTSVTTGGGQILVENNDIEIKPTLHLTCGGPPGGGRQQIVKTGGTPVPYYSLPNLIILKPTQSIVRDANSRFTSCIVIPDWYQAQYQLVNTARTTRSLIDNIEHKFTGTATRCGTAGDGSNQDGEACNMQDVLILGFDVCDDTRGAAHAYSSNLKFECNVGEFIHNNGGGMRLESASVENFIETANLHAGDNA